MRNFAAQIIGHLGEAEETYSPRQSTVIHRTPFCLSTIQKTQFQVVCRERKNEIEKIIQHYILSHCFKFHFSNP